MNTNMVAPWEGQLHWVGQPKEGVSQNTGNAWKFVDFTLKYQDSRMQDAFITFKMSGPERVDRLLSLPLGTKVRVMWWPNTDTYTNQQNETRWYPSLNATGFQVVSDQPAQQTVPQGQYGARPQYQAQPQGYQQTPQGQNYGGAPQQAYQQQPAQPAYQQQYQAPVQQPATVQPQPAAGDDLPF